MKSDFVEEPKGGYGDKDLGLGRPNVRREDLPKEAPRALEPEEQKRFMRAVERCTSIRDRAIALLLFYTALRATSRDRSNIGGGRFILIHFYLLFCILCFTSMRFPRVKAEGQSFYH